MPVFSLQQSGPDEPPPDGWGNQQHQRQLHAFKGQEGPHAHRQRPSQGNAGLQALPGRAQRVEGSQPQQHHSSQTGTQALFQNVHFLHVRFLDS